MKSITQKQHFALIGNPVAQSLSAVMHTALYAHLGLPWTYEALKCRTEKHARAVMEDIRTGGRAGANVTFPYKQLALQCADESDVLAQCAGGANVLFPHDGKLMAHNTDGAGALAALKRVWSGDLQHARVAIFGTGATARSIAAAFVCDGVQELTLFSRQLKRACTIINRLETALHLNKTNLQAACYEQACRIIPQQNLLINATPVGMQSTKEQCVIDCDLVQSHHFVMDVVYSRDLTPLLLAAKKRGASNADGKEMLVQQAALSIELWRDAYKMDFEVNREILRDACSFPTKSA